MMKWFDAVDEWCRDHLIWFAAIYTAAQITKLLCEAGCIGSYP